MTCQPLRYCDAVAATWLSPAELGAWRRLCLMQLQLEARLGRGTSAHGLSYQDYLVLASLSDRPGGRCRVTELSADLGWEKSRGSHHLSRMCARGLIEKQPCPTDLRGTNVAITKRGRAAIAEAAPDHVAQVRELFVDVLTAEQLAVVDDVARAVLSRLGAEPDG